MASFLLATDLGATLKPKACRAIVRWSSGDFWAAAEKGVA